MSSTTSSPSTETSATPGSPPSQARPSPTPSPRKPSVSEIVGMIYPFDPTQWDLSLTADRIRNKVLPNGIAAAVDGGLSRKYLLETLNELGTTVHAAAREYSTLGYSNRWEGTPFEKYVKAVHDFLDQGRYVVEESEVYGECEEYRGTSDGIARHVATGNRFVFDWKTWGAYKPLYGLREDKSKGVMDKVKKTGLQLSLYRRMLEPAYGPFHGQLVFHVTDDGVHVYEAPYDLSPWEQWKRSQSVSEEGAPVINSLF